MTKGSHVMPRKKEEMAREGLAEEHLPSLNSQTYKYDPPEITAGLPAKGFAETQVRDGETVIRTTAAGWVMLNITSAGGQIDSSLTNDNPEQGRSAEAALSQARQDLEDIRRGRIAPSAAALGLFGETRRPEGGRG
jgi:hypothetical protein